WTPITLPRLDLRRLCDSRVGAGARAAKGHEPIRKRALATVLGGSRRLATAALRAAWRALPHGMRDRSGPRRDIQALCVEFRGSDEFRALEVAETAWREARREGRSLSEIARKTEQLEEATIKAEVCLGRKVVALCAELRAQTRYTPREHWATYLAESRGA